MVSAPLLLGEEILPNSLDHNHRRLLIPYDKACARNTYGVKDHVVAGPVRA